MSSRSVAIALAFALAAPSFARADSAHFTVILGGKNGGHLTAAAVPKIAEAAPAKP